jgi:opacity protein-like surface antigen
MRIKSLILVLALAAGFATPAAAASWANPGFRVDVQAQKGRPGQDGGQKGRDYRPDRRGGGDDRREHERLNDDERRALHRDLDKASREIYKPRPR